MLYRIGEFSKIVDIPARTLRYYAENGVLVPSDVDKFTGYKYYSDENILECETIKLLKSLDFTLEEIKNYKDCIDEEILEKKKKEIEERIYLLRLKYERISYMQDKIKKDICYSKLNESDEEKVLRRKYEARNFRKNI